MWSEWDARDWRFEVAEGGVVCTVCTPLGNFPIKKTVDCTYSEMFGRIGGHALRCAGRPVIRRRIYARSFSGQAGAGTAAASAPSPLAGITAELDRIAPRFEVPASQIHIIDTPANFYSTLKVCTLAFPCCAKHIGANWEPRRTKSAMPAGAFTSPHCTLARQNMTSSRH
jgi:hypothetical protein